MNQNLDKLKVQSGIGLVSLVGYLFAVLFLIIAVNYRLNQTDMTANGDLMFRLVMLVYFVILTYKQVPVLATQQFLIDVMEQDKGSHEDKMEYIMLVFSVLFGFLLTGSLIFGTAGDPDRRGGSEYDSLTQPGEFWIAFLAGYFLFAFVSASYWYLRQRRLAGG